MAADIGLIKAAKDAYSFQNPNFGKALSDPIKEGDKRRRDQSEKLRVEQNVQAERFRREKKATEERINREITSYMDQFPPGIPISSIPEKYRPQISEFAFKQKGIFNNAITTRSKMQAGTSEYQEQTDLMNGALQSVANLKSQWDLFGQGKEDNLANFSAEGDLYGNFSRSNSLGKIALNGALFTDKLNATISDQGDLFFNDGQGGVFKMSDLELPSMKSAQEAMGIETLLVSAYENGVRLNDTSLDYNMSQIKKTIEKGGIDVLKSLAVDDLVAGVNLLDSDDEIFTRLNSKDLEVAVEAKEELEQFVYSQYRSALQSQAEQGYRIKNPAPQNSNKHMSWFNSNAGVLYQYAPSLGENESRLVLQNSKMVDSTGGKSYGDLFKLGDILNEEVYSDGYSVEWNEEQQSFELLNQRGKEGMRFVNFYKVEDIPRLMQYIDMNPNG